MLEFLGGWCPIPDSNRELYVSETPASAIPPIGQMVRAVRFELTKNGV